MDWIKENKAVSIMGLVIALLAAYLLFVPTETHKTKTTNRSFLSDIVLDPSIVDTGANVGDITNITVQNVPSVSEEQMDRLISGFEAVLGAQASKIQGEATRTVAEAGLIGEMQNLVVVKQDGVVAEATRTFQEGEARRRESIQEAERLEAERQNLLAQADQQKAETQRTLLQNCINLYDEARATGIKALFETRPSRSNLTRVFGQNFQGCFPLLAEEGYQWDENQ